MYEVSLTFDNGPNPEVTSRVLDVLARHELLATFFVVGNQLADPDAWRVCQRAHAAGHWIGNHSWSHSRPIGEIVGRESVEAEILPTEELIASLAHPDRLFRPPGGGGQLDHRLLNEAAVRCIERHRLTCVLWNVVPRDWEDAEGWVDRALAMCRLQPWSLVVLHDKPNGAMDHLYRFVETVRDTGGQFRQDFPPDCVPIRSGRIVTPIDQYLSK